MATVTVFVLLCLAVILAGLALATRTHGARPVETFVALSTYIVLLVLVPIVGLAWLGWLTRPALAAAIGLESTVALAWCSAGGTRVSLGSMAHALRAILRLPMLATGRHVHGGLGLWVWPCLAICLWTLGLSYLAPASGWDGLWYHDPIVGFAIQHHGFAWLDVPGQLALVNGYPKNAEMLSLWFAIFTGRELIEAPASLMALLLLSATYLVHRNLGLRRSTALAAAALFFLMPAVALQLRSTYIDLSCAALLSTSLAFLTRPSLRGQDVLLCGLSVAVLAGAKATGALLVFVVLPLLVVRTVLAGMGRKGWAALCIALLALSVLAAPYYVRNWERTHNPTWPAHLEIKPLGLKWQGRIFFKDNAWTVARVREVFEWPQSGRQFADTRDNGYGNALPWLLPLSLLGCGLAVWRGATGSLRRRRRYRLILGMCTPMIALIAASPGWWWARLNLHVVLGLTVLCALAIQGLPRWLGTVTWHAGLAVSFLVLLASRPGWDVPPDLALKLFNRSALERDAWPVARKAPPERVALARERELVAGAVVAFSDRYPFLGPLWNRSYSNRLHYVPWRGAAGYRRGLEQLGTTWAVARRGTPQYSTLAQPHSGWRLAHDLGFGDGVFVRTPR